VGTKLEGINPVVLTWARERSGRSIEEVARALDREPATIQAWELGEDAPTYSQLESLAYKLYKRPLALFFFPAPPDEADPHREFRTLPEFEVDHLGPVTRYRIREAQSLQLSLRQLTNGRNPATRLIFRDLNPRPTDPTTQVAQVVRDYLGIPVETQRVGWRNFDEAQKGWRGALEAVGIFVFKEAFRQDEVSGFCLYDEVFPVIYVNNSVPVARQIFTYFHELAHILLDTSGITKLDNSFVGALRGESRRIEVFCNRFAADFLVPWSSLEDRARGLEPTDDRHLEQLAAEFKVSRETILRRFLDRGRVSQDFYEGRAEEWREEAKRSRRRSGGGGNYYRTHAAYLGSGYLRLAFGRYYKGDITMEELAQHLNVNPRAVAGLEDAALQAQSG
jgi:Zn-dependent peptidase ImmA (M78 family)